MAPASPLPLLPPNKALDMDANTAREAIDYLLGSPFEKEESAAEKGEGRGKPVPAYYLSRFVPPHTLYIFIALCSNACRVVSHDQHKQIKMAARGGVCEAGWVHGAIRSH
jgi:hypothetical protein